MILVYFLNTLVSNPKPGVGFLSSFDSLERLHGSVFTCVSKVLDVFSTWDGNTRGKNNQA